MLTDYLFNQPNAPGVDLARLRDGAWSLEVRRQSFDSLTIGMHWTSALLVLALFASAWLHAVAEAQHSDLTPFLLQIHRSLGITVWTITALRLAWRLAKARVPPLSPQLTKLHRVVVKLGECGLYALLLGQPATGLLMTLAAGRPFALFMWHFQPLMAQDDRLRAAFHFLHELGAWALAAAALGHAAAALFHHFVLRDDVLASMAPVVPPAGPRRERVTILPAEIAARE
jgi:cytochrome b561